MSLYKRKGTSVYWCRFYVKGEQIRKSTGETDRKRAEAAERRIRVEEEAKPRAAAPDRGITLADLCGHDILRAEASKRDLNPQTIPTIKIFWSHIIRHFGDVHPGKVTSDGIDAYVAARRRQKIRGQSIRRELQALKRGLTIARKKGWIGQVPEDWPRIKSDPKSPTQKGKLHPPHIIAAFLQELQRRSQDARDEIDLALLTGLRASELKRVMPDWVEPSMMPGDPVPAILRLPEGKTKSGRERIVALPRTALDIIERRVAAARGADVPVLSPEEHRTVYRQAAAWLKKEHGYSKRITRRDMRHTFTTLTDKHGKDRKAVQDALGHSKSDMTDLYLHSDEDRIKALGPATESWYTEIAAGGNGKTSTEKQAQIDKTAQFGRGERIRTSDPLTPSQTASGQIATNPTYGQHPIAADTQKAPQISTANKHSEHSTGDAARALAEAVRQEDADPTEIHDRLLSLARLLHGGEDP